MAIHVYHDPDLFTDNPRGLHFVHVATVETDDLEEAYRLTNTIERGWWENSGVQALVGPTRSTSVGDILVKDNHAYEVSRVGFRPVLLPWSTER